MGVNDIATLHIISKFSEQKIDEVDMCFKMFEEKVSLGKIL